MNFLEQLIAHKRPRPKLETVEQFSRRVETIPGLTDCPECGCVPLRLASSNVLRCRCGWTGVILRALP